MNIDMTQLNVDTIHIGSVLQHIKTKKEFIVINQDIIGGGNIYLLYVVRSGGRGPLKLVKEIPDCDFHEYQLKINNTW